MSDEAIRDLLKLHIEHDEERATSFAATVARIQADIANQSARIDGLYWKLGIITGVMSTLGNFAANALIGG